MSFRLKTILGVALIEAIMLALLIISVMTMLTQTNEDLVQRHAHITADNFAAMAKEPLLSSDLARLQATVGTLTKNADVVYARILDQDGRELAATALKPAAFAPDDTLEQALDGVFDVFSPVKVGQQAVGVVQLGLDVQNLRQTVERAQLWSWGIAAAELLLVGLFSLALGTYLTRHLKLLSDGAAAIREGQLGIQIPVSGGDELAQVSLAFNTMSLQLKEERDRQQAITHDLLAAREAAEAAALAKSRFLATVSHELRTPMNGILGMAQLLQQADLSVAKRQEFVRVILQSGQTLLALLNGILDYSKLEAGKLHIDSQSFDMPSLLKETLLPFEGEAALKGLDWRLSWEGPNNMVYEGDALRLRQIVSNLASNAIKFTAQGAIQIRVQELAREGDKAELLFEIKDTGIGINPEQQDSLFQAFTQAENSTTRRFGGTGLGLSIVRSLVELMGGQVGLRSAPGQGSTFWFRLQLGCKEKSPLVPRLEALQIAPLRPHWHGLKRVLVVEDNPLNQNIICNLLEPLGIAVAAVDDGAQALKELDVEPLPDLILMDLQMPVMNGFDATQAIRQSRAASHISTTPIVALTADAFEHVRAKCLQVGMNDVLTKPVVLDHLIALLLKHLGPPEPVALPVPSVLRSGEWLEQFDAALLLIEQRRFDALSKIEDLHSRTAHAPWAVPLGLVAQHLRHMQFEAAHAQLSTLIAQQTQSTSP